jgi:putative oxidoreductase
MSSKAFLLLFARLLMSSLFVWDGVVQLQSRRHGAIFRQRSRARARYRGLDLDTGRSVGGLALLAGLYSRWAGALLALVCLGTAFGVHLPAGDQDNMIHFYKNLVMTGGFLYVIAFGPGGLGLSTRAA